MAQSDFSRTARAESKIDTPKAAFHPCLHDQALVGAERSRVGIPPSRKALWRDKSAWPSGFEQAG
jgi:hypothetical protein